MCLPISKFTLKTAAGRKVQPGQPYIAGLYYQVEMALYDVDGMQLTDEVYTGVAGVDDGTQKTPDASKPTALALTARLTTGAGAATTGAATAGPAVNSNGPPTVAAGYAIMELLLGKTWEYAGWA